MLYEVLGRAGTNIFVGLSEGQWREARKIIIHCILGTDMTHHFDQIKSTQVRSRPSLPQPCGPNLLDSCSWR